MGFLGSVAPVRFVGFETVASARSVVSVGSVESVAKGGVMKRRPSRILAPAVPGAVTRTNRNKIPFGTEWQRRLLTGLACAKHPSTLADILGWHGGEEKGLEFIVKSKSFLVNTEIDPILKQFIIFTTKKERSR